jgi:flagellar hook-basal body complex protein FliE
MYNKNLNKMTQEQLRMQVLAGIITESQYKRKLSEGKFSEFIKNTFTSATKNQELAQDAAEAAEAAAQKASDDEVAKLEALVSDPKFKEELIKTSKDLSSKAEDTAFSTTGDRSNAQYVYASGMAEYLKAKGINPDVIKTFSDVLANAMK